VVTTEAPANVYFKGVCVGEYFADLLINFGRDGVTFKRAINQRISPSA
jgi:hypothetical protein